MAFEGYVSKAYVFSRLLQDCDLAPGFLGKILITISLNFNAMTSSSLKDWIG